MKKRQIGLTNFERSMMNRKGIFAIIIAVLIFAAVVLFIETPASIWHVILGFFFAWGITLGFANLRNALIILTMTLVLLVMGYLSIEYRWFDIIPGVIIGVSTGLLMHFGWIVPHKPFSRSDYIKTQEDQKTEQNGV